LIIGEHAGWENIVLKGENLQEKKPGKPLDGLLRDGRKFVN
jgi:hypothetical protein